MYTHTKVSQNVYFVEGCTIQNFAREKKPPVHDRYRHIDCFVRRQAQRPNQGAQNNRNK